MEEAKEVHKCLRTAAGIFTAIKVLCTLFLMLLAVMFMCYILIYVKSYSETTSAQCCK